MRTLAGTFALVLAITPPLPSSMVEAQERRGGIDPERLIDILRETAAAREASKLDRTGDAETARDREVAREVRRTLAGRRITVNFDRTPLAECLDFLRDVTGMNLVITKGAAEAAAEAPVTLRLRDIRLKDCLELLLQQAHPDLRYGIRHGVLAIGLKDEWRTNLRLVLYDVSDLLHRPPDFPGPRMGLDGVKYDD
ncbi:MAG: hypothetical protein KF878_27120 [Planctomycetes bacterium]|nr:hypothetical protein [Planctomycetota bacterium]